MAAMADNAPVLFRPDEEDQKLIAESISFHGGKAPDAIRRGLRAGHRELSLLKGVHSEARKTANAKGKGSGRRKP